MDFIVKTYQKPCVLEVVVAASVPSKIRLIVNDSEDPERVFTNRYKNVNGSYVFNIRLPESPGAVKILLYNEAIGERPRDKETTFDVVTITPVKFKRRLDPQEINDAPIRSFVEFAESFAWHVHNMGAGEVYASSDNKFFIELLDVIVDKEGKALPTPARISRTLGRIQVSKSAMASFTVPMRLAILFHEFSHYFLNVQIDDESEADLNGLLIYLALGYPPIEGYQAFIETFKTYPSVQNGERFKRIDKFITDYEKSSSSYA